MTKIPRKLHRRKEEAEDSGREFNKELELKNEIAKVIFEEANYNHKFTFFIPAIEEFNNLPTIAFIDDIRSIEVNNERNSAESLLRNRICSLKTPWREKLGHKVGYIFNRVSTDTPKTSEIGEWWPGIYDTDYIEALAKI